MGLWYSPQKPLPHTLPRALWLLKQKHTHIPVVHWLWTAGYFSAPQLVALSSPHQKGLATSLSSCPGVLTFNMLSVKAPVTLYQSSYTTCPGLLLRNHHDWERSSRRHSSAPGQMQTQEQDISGWELETIPYHVLPQPPQSVKSPLQASCHCPSICQQFPELQKVRTPHDHRSFL